MINPRFIIWPCIAPKVCIPICVNHIRDTVASLIDEVCHDDQIEPHPQPLEDETSPSNATTADDDARLVIKATGLRENSCVPTFFDVKIFNPLTKACPKSLPDAYRYHESIRKQNTNNA